MQSHLPPSLRDRLPLALKAFSRGQFEAAVTEAQGLLVEFPAAPVLYNLLASALSKLEKGERSAQAFGYGLIADPRDSKLYNSVGTAASNQHRDSQATKAFRRSLCLKPDDVTGYQNLGALAERGSHLPAASKAYDRAVSIAPDQRGLKDRRAEVRIRWVNMLARRCDWHALEPLAPMVEGLGLEGPGVNPFPFLALEDAPARQLKRAANFAQTVTPPSAVSTFSVPGDRPDRLRIGYFSSDFHDHAVMYLAAGLFERHDRGRFEIIGYSYGRDSTDENRRRARGALDVFREVRGLSDEQIAEQARTDRIDIAVDLKGHISDSRARLFSHRPAPLSATYLGYPGTTGATYIDYVIADRVVAPEGSSAVFSEQIVRMPNCYQINDDQRYRPTGSASRSMHGLPEDRFVFCCFNDLYKVTEETFVDWMAILQRVDGSVLWLLNSRDDAVRNLSAYAAKRGIDPSRLIFAEPVPNPDHLERLGLADLVIDTFPYGAHTTASDALWAGVPIVTRTGEGFQTRVCASLLTTVGLETLITRSRDAFRALAGDLAQNRSRLDEIRKYLTETVRTTPLYDTTAFTHDLERVYDEMHRIYRSGEHPRPIDVATLIEGV